MKAAIGQLYQAKELRLMDDGWFDAVVCGDMAACPKPAPDGYELAARLLRAAPAQCLAIEESSSGIRAPKSAGMYVVGLKASAVPQRTDEADLEVNSFADIPL